MIHKDPRTVRILFELTLANMAVLWDGAASKAITVHEMTDDDVMETLGPREDPDAPACATMLFDTVARWSGATDVPMITVTRLDEKTTRSARPLLASSDRREAIGA